MSLYIILFFVTLLIASSLIARRIWQLRTGRIVLDPSYEKADWTDISIMGVRTRLIELSKFAVHYSALFLLKLWILSSNTLRLFDRFVRRMLVKVLHRNAHRPIRSDITPSEFLKDVSAHKEELRKEE